MYVNAVHQTRLGLHEPVLDIVVEESSLPSACRCAPALLSFNTCLPHLFSPRDYQPSAVRTVSSSPNGHTYRLRASCLLAHGRPHRNRQACLARINTTVGLLAASFFVPRSSGHFLVYLKPFIFSFHLLILDSLSSRYSLDNHGVSCQHSSTKVNLPLPCWGGTQAVVHCVQHPGLAKPWRFGHATTRL